MFTKKELETRFGFHKQTELSTRQHHAVRAAYLTFAEMLDRILPDGREKALAFTELENSSMWSHKAIAQTAPLAPLPSEYKPLVIDEELVGLLSGKFDMSEYVTDGTITEEDAQRLANLPDMTGAISIDPTPVSVEVTEVDMDKVDLVVHEAIDELIKANPQFTKPHVSVIQDFIKPNNYRLILSQGPKMQEVSDDGS